MDKTQSIVKEKLIELGYFKYVNELQKELVMAQTFENYQDNGAINFPWEGTNRIFSIDAEFIYEAEGVKDQIQGMLDLFSALGIALVIEDYIEEFNDETNTYTERSITLSGKKYDVSGVEDWATAFYAGINLIESILADHGLTEKAYFLNMDETSAMILLDEPLYNYLNEIIPEDAERPMPIEQGSM